MSQILC